MAIGNHGLNGFLPTARARGAMEIGGPINMRGRPNAGAINLATGTGAFRAYNTADEFLNYERFEMGWGLVTSNVFGIRANKGGSGTNRAVSIMLSGSSGAAINITGATNGGLTLNSNGASSAITLGQTIVGSSSSAISSTSGNNINLNILNNFAPTSTSTAVAIPLRVAPIINYSAGTPGAGSYEALKISVTETALPTGTNYLIRASAGSAGTTDLFTVTNTANMVLTQPTITADAQAISTTVTWNSGGTTFTHLKTNITDTASAAGSLLLDLQVGAATKCSVRKDGLITAFGANLDSAAINRIPTINYTIPANYSIVIPESFELTSGIVCDVGSTAIMEIT